MGVMRRRHLAAAVTLLLFSSTVSFVHGHVGLHPGGGDPGRVELTQKRFGGPGSAPPSCRSKCGRCSPCSAVHVPIQPGFSTPLEYYPEAWRCKCGNKLFMP